MRPLLLGHRGARNVRRSWVPQVSRFSRPGYSRASCDPVPAENTIPAFDYAMANGCDGFEFDLRYTRDRRHVLCHDPKLGTKEIAATDYAGLERRRGYNLPCLEDVLTRFGTTAYLDIELKVPGNERAVVSALHAHPPQRGFVVSSFLPEVLLRLHQIHAPLPLAYICKDAEEAELWAELPIRTFIPHYSLVSERLVAEVHRRGMQLFTWTVNNRGDMRRLASWGVDGLISDNPTLLATTFPAAIAASG